MREGVDMRLKLATKVFCIISITLFVGFTILGCTALWLSIDSTMSLKTAASGEIGVSIQKSVEEFMMIGNQEAVNRYVKRLKDDKTVIDLGIYNKTGTLAAGDRKSVV